MIRLVKNSEIDKQAYDDCVVNAVNSTMYALSWYLDIVADDWACLVHGDYEQVMPIPYVKLKRNLFQKRILQPNFCQQLGLFSSDEISAMDFREFYAHFLKLKPVSYHFNNQNAEKKYAELASLASKDNYELNLSHPYEKLYSAYSQNLKRNVKSAVKFELNISNEASIDDLISFKLDLAQVKMNNVLQSRMKLLLTALVEREMGEVLAVKDTENEMVAIAFVTKYKNRLTHLFSASNESGKQKKAMPYLFDALIREHAGKDMIFDFEGSMIPGVARFFKSFGSTSFPYKHFLK